MTGNRKNTSASSYERIGSDMAKVDAHVIQPEEYEEIPELTDEMIARSVLMINGVPVKRGRPMLPSPKQSVTLRLDADVLGHFRGLGPGWQTRINDVLRRSAKLNRA